MKQVYLNLRHEIKNKKLSQKEIAEMLNISYVSLGEKLRGNRIWTSKEIDFLLKKFRKKYEYLFKKEEKNK